MFSNRDPRYNTYRHLIGGIYTIEGGIGIGKTTLGVSLENYLNNIGLKAKFFKEYNNLDLLDQYISNMKKYAYTFQLIMLFKRIEIYKEAEKYSREGGISLIDRSIIGDMTFAKMQLENGNITIDEWEKYLCVMKSEIQLEPSACIYLKSSTETAMKRIQKRGILSEINGYTIDYITQLNDTYNKVFAEIENITVIILDWNIELDIIDGKIKTNSIETILDFLL